MKKGETLKDEYDFKGAERGKFYRKDAVLVPPVRLEPEVLQFLLERAQARGATLDELVNELLRKDIELIQAAS
jgi:CRISPR/Cas system-associated protein Csm6